MSIGRNIAGVHYSADGDLGNNVILISVRY